MMRIGAPLAKVPMAADTPEAAAMSMLPPIMAWIDSGPAVGVENIEIEAVLLENAGALAEFGDAGVPGALLRDGDLERVVGGGKAAGPGERQEAQEDENDQTTHDFLRTMTVQR